MEGSGTAIEEERQIPEIRLDHVIMGDAKEGKNTSSFDGKRTSDESCAEHCGPEEVDWRMNMSQVGGVVS